MTKRTATYWHDGTLMTVGVKRRRPLGDAINRQALERADAANRHTCQECDCADPTALPGLSADCDCSCHH